MTALIPEEFLAVVEDASQSGVDARYVRRCYERQLVAARRDIRDPLDPDAFVAALVSHADVDIADPDRDRLQEAYQEQLKNARKVACDPRV